MTFSWILYYFSWTVCIALIIALAYGIIKRKWELVKRFTKFAINSSVLLIGWSFYLELALIVRSPILITKEASLESLRDWIWNYQFKDILISLATAIILLGINLFFYYKVENKNHKSDLPVLTILTISVLAIFVWFTGEDTYYGFVQEPNKH